MHATITNQTVLDAKAGSSDAAEAIVSAMSAQVHKLANRICGQYHRTDAVAEGMEAVWSAVLSYDPTASASFMTHAYGMVRMALLAFVSSNGPGPTVPSRSVKRYQHNLNNAAGDPDEALRMLRMGDHDVTSLGTADAFMAAHAALTDPQHVDRLVTDDGEMTALELTDRNVDVEETALNRVVVEALLGECNEREVLILSMTYGIGGQTEMKDQDIATALGISRPRVVTIRKAAQERLAASNTELAQVI